MSVCVLTVFNYFLFFLSVCVLLTLDGEIKMYINHCILSRKKPKVINTHNTEMTVFHFQCIFFVFAF